MQRIGAASGAEFLLRPRAYSIPFDGLRGHRVVVSNAVAIDRLWHDGKLDARLSLPQDFVAEVAVR